MSFALLAIVTLIYASIAVSRAITKDWNMAIVFTGYALANVGLLGAMK